MEERKEFEFISSLSWKKFEFMLSLEKREKFPKFEFISSLSYSWIFIIKLYMEKKISKFNIAFCSSCKVNPSRNAISSLPRRFIEYKIQFLIVSFVLSISDILFFFSILKRSNKNSPWKFFISDVIDCSFQKLNGIESLN